MRLKCNKRKFNHYHLFVFIFNILLLIQGGENECLDGWKSFGVYCIWLSKKLTSHSTALSECQRWNASLPHVTSLDRKEFITNLTDISPQWVQSCIWRSSHDLLARIIECDFGTQQKLWVRSLTKKLKKRQNIKGNEERCEYIQLNNSSNRDLYIRVIDKFCTLSLHYFCIRPNEEEIEYSCPQCLPKKRSRRYVHLKKSPLPHRQWQPRFSSHFHSPFLGPFDDPLNHGLSVHSQGQHIQPKIIRPAGRLPYTDRVRLGQLYPSHRYFASLGLPKLDEHVILNSYQVLECSAEKPFGEFCYVIRSNSKLNWETAKEKCHGFKKGVIPLSYEGSRMSDLSKAPSPYIWTGLRRAYTSIFPQEDAPLSNKITNWMCGVNSYDEALTRLILSFKNCSEEHTVMCKYRESNDSDASTTAIPQSCPNQWFPMFGQCYKYFDDPKEFRDAVNTCKESKGEILSIDLQDSQRLRRVLKRLLPDSQQIIWLWMKGSHFMQDQPPEEKDKCLVIEIDSIQMVSIFCRGRRYPFICSSNAEAEEFETSTMTNPLADEHETIIPSTERPPLEGPCPKNNYNWVRFGDFCYKLVSYTHASHPKSWRKAQSSCQMEYSTLASIHTLEENLWIADQIKLFTDHFVWIGARREGKESFKWDDGTPFNFSHWGEGEPNNSKEAEECIAMYTHHSTGPWNDAQCKDGAGYICKKSVPQDSEEATFQSTTLPSESTQDPTESTTDITPSSDSLQVSTVTLAAPTMTSDMTSTITDDVMTERTVVLTKQLPGFRAFSVGGCPEGWNRMGSRCVRYFDQRKNFRDAARRCHGQGKGGSLVSIHSLKELYFLYALIPTMASVWIGLRFSIIREEFVWEDNSSVDFLLWARNEPTTDGTAMSIFNTDFEGCVQMSMSGTEPRTWHDVGCSSYAEGFVCQKPSDQSLPRSIYPFPKICSVSSMDSFFAYGDGCYKLMREPLSWQEANLSCKKMGAQLASVRNAAENAYLWTQFSEEEHLKKFWIGLFDKQEDRQFTWIDKWPLLFRHWGTYEPSATLEKGCVYMNMHRGTWVTERCNQKMSFMCHYTENNLIPSQSSEEDGCPNGHNWVDLGKDFCYKVSWTLRKTWFQANHECIQEGGQLATIHTQNVSDNLKKIVTHLREPIWIGATRLKNRKFGWIGSTDFNFTNWARGEPNSISEECLEMNIYGEWNDVRCLHEMSYICQVSKTFFRSLSTGRPSDNSLGGLAITGIVILVLLIIGSLGFLGFTYLKRKRKQEIAHQQYTFDNVTYRPDAAAVGDLNIASTFEERECILDPEDDLDDSEDK